jgi:hypothetical protein
LRALSPGRTAYALAGSQHDCARGKGEVHGPLVVDLASGTASELRVSRRRMPFANIDDMARDRVAHHFEWQCEAAGREQPLPRAGVHPRPWRSRLLLGSAGELDDHAERMPPAFVAELRRIVLALPSAALSPDWIDPRQGIDRELCNRDAAVVERSYDGVGEGAASAR